MELLPKDVIIMISRIVDAKAACSLKVTSKKFNSYIKTIDLKAHYISLSELGFTKDFETYNYAVRHTPFNILALHHANDEELVHFALTHNMPVMSKHIYDEYIDQMNFMALYTSHIETLKALRSLGLFRYTNQIHGSLCMFDADAVKFIYKSFLCNIDLDNLNVIKSSINVGNVSGTAEFIRCAIDMGYAESQIQKKVENASYDGNILRVYNGRTDSVELIDYKLPLCRANIYRLTINTLIQPLTVVPGEVSNKFDMVKDQYDMLNIIYTMTITQNFSHDGNLCVRLLNAEMTHLYWQAIRDLQSSTILASAVVFMGHTYKDYGIKFTLTAPSM